MEIQQLQLRESANHLYQSKDFNGAIAIYSEAIARSPNDPVLFCNRAAAHLALGNFEEAECDSRLALSIDPSSEKGTYRLGLALKGRKKIKQALEVFDGGVRLFPLNVQMKICRDQCLSQLGEMQRKRRKLLWETYCQPEVDFSHSSCGIDCSHVPNRPLAESMDIFCQDCNAVTPRPPNRSVLEFTPLEYDMLQCAQSLVKRLKAGLPISDSSNALQGVFCQLLEKEKFIQLLFPGTPVDAEDYLPHNLKELLSWESIELDLPKIAKSCAKILENVKTKGAQAGDIMDKRTEDALLPQIVQEAVGREIVDVVRKLTKLLSKMKSKISLRPAELTPEMRAQDDESLYDGLSSDMIGSLVDSGFGVQNDYLGVEWSLLIAEDAQRFLQNERMTKMANWRLSDKNEDANGHEAVPLVCWLEQEKIAENYPALAEAISRLQALPYEVNDKTRSRWQLLTPSNGCTLLTFFPIGSGQPERVDNRIRKLESVESNSMEREQLEISTDSGLRLSCSYNFCNGSSIPVEAAAEIGDLATLVWRSDAVHPRQFVVKNDQLVVHESAKVWNERQAASCDYFSLAFFIHGSAEAESLN